MLITKEVLASCIRLKLAKEKILACIDQNGHTSYVAYKQCEDPACQKFGCFTIVYPSLGHWSIESALDFGFKFRELTSDEKDKISSYFDDKK